MGLLQHIRKAVVALSLVLVLLTTSACSGAMQASQPSSFSGNQVSGYNQVERGNTQTGQDFGDWVVQTGKGMVKDAYVRGDDKLGVIISSQVRPNEVRPLAKSLVQGFQKNFPSRDLTVLMYAPDKQLILKAKYDNSTRQIEYQ